eukprot:scaffold64620_cov29-Tisochrysis_lutea.AAC.5
MGNRSRLRLKCVHTVEDRNGASLLHATHLFSPSNCTATPALPFSSGFAWRPWINTRRPSSPPFSAAASAAAASASASPLAVGIIVCTKPSSCCRKVFFGPSCAFSGEVAARNTAPS